MKKELKKRWIAMAVSVGLCAGAFVAAPAISAHESAATQAFTCVIFRNENGGFSQADGCKASRYWEKANGNWTDAGWKKRGHKSQFNVCHYRWEKSDYEQSV
ncbi:hypothetical protein [Schaalia sp. lx-260]|uniref:hypothetical protein n=1 Tax=Schaalia sp. lx-260 TaxID=2899082 RepID=UPI001E3DBE8F|nr:hypothetical protein [Schaalia sp. lx-260]MCD4550270.1 hypothetical protein [Schaalia sp. lx-260]